MPKERKKSLCMDTLRHAEYYGMLQTFDDLYAKSKSGEKFPNLMELILSQDNIMLAYRNIKSNTGSYTAGTDHQNIGDIGKLPPSVVIEKVRKIVTGSQHGYRPKPVRRKDIPKPNGKTRPLGIPCIWDRLIQQCIRKRMESGTYHTSSVPYGYKQVNYDLVPIPNQIEIVKGIFNAFLQGKSTTKIADDLNRLHPDVDKHWHHTTIERIQNGLITPDTAQAEYVRQIYQLYLAGNSLQEIAKHLQANSIPYSDETGWNKNTVHRIVKNPAYTGRDSYPPIVEEALFQKAQVLCQRKAPTYTESLKDIRGDIICPDCGSRMEWQTKGHRWRCRHCAAFSVRIEPDILLQSITTTMKRLQDNPNSIDSPPLSHNTVSIEAEKRQVEIDEMLSAGNFDAESLIQNVLARADAQYLCCTAGKADPMTLRIKEALAAAPPCDTFDPKLYHAITDKIVLHRTTSIQLKLVNGMVV